MNRELIGENKKKFISYKNILNKSNFLNKEQEQIKTNLFLCRCHGKIMVELFYLIQILLFKYNKNYYKKNNYNYLY